MSITFDQIITFAASPVSITPGAGGVNNLLVIYTQGTNTDSSTPTVDGSNSTAVGTSLARPSSTAFSEVHYFKGASAGSSHSIVLPGHTAGFVVSYFDVDPTTPIENNNEGSNLAASVTPANSGEWAICFIDNASAGSPNGSATTTRASGAPGYAVDSNGTITKNVAFSVGFSVGNFAAQMITINQRQYTLTATTGAFTLTGYATSIFWYVYTLVAAVGTFAVTGFKALINLLPAVSWSNSSKSSNSWQNQQHGQSGN